MKEEDGENHMGTLLDFNSALGQDSITTQGLDTREDRLDRLKRDLNANARSVLTHLLPGGMFDKPGRKFYCGDIHGNPGESLVVELTDGKFGVWSDFAEQQSGGDLIDLWKSARNCSFAEAIRQIESWLSLPTSDIGATKTMPSAEPGNGSLPVKCKGETRQQYKSTNLGPPTRTWHYHDRDGKIVGSQTRYDPKPGKKEFRPWCVKSRSWTFPDPRPLYNVQEILKAETVLQVEGEKCADALISLGYCATTVMGGAQSPPDKTDWSPLSGKDVIIWPDNDEAGNQYAKNIEPAIRSVAKSLKILVPPGDKPKKWDAADAVQEGFDVKKFVEGEENLQKPRIFLRDWDIAVAYTGTSPEREWLVDHVFPMASVSILAAMGGSGKGMLGVDLGLKVVCGFKADLLNTHPSAFGNNVVQNGDVVIFTAEDDRDEIHRRINEIDPSENRFKSKNRLIVVPIPNTGGPMPIVVPGKNGPEVSPLFMEVREQLRSITNLKLVIFDPLSSFVLVDINKEPTTASFVNSVFSALAADTRAAVLLAHHLNKGLGDRPVHTPEQAREKIRGTSAVVDGVRCAYCLWPMETERAKRVCRRLEMEYARNKVYLGAVVKANCPVDNEVKTFVRQENGLLSVMNDVLRATKVTNTELVEILLEDIGKASIHGRPFTVTGQAGLYERKDELSFELREISKHKLASMANEMLDSGTIVRCIAKGSKNPKWLDVPEGPFSMGTGRFEPGFVSILAGND